MVSKKKSTKKKPAKTVRKKPKPSTRVHRKISNEKPVRAAQDYLSQRLKMEADKVVANFKARQSSEHYHGERHRVAASIYSEIQKRMIEWDGKIEDFITKEFVEDVKSRIVAAVLSRVGDPGDLLRSIFMTFIQGEVMRHVTDEAWRAIDSSIELHIAAVRQKE